MIFVRRNLFKELSPVIIEGEDLEIANEKINKMQVLDINYKEENNDC